MERPPWLTDDSELDGAGCHAADGVGGPADVDCTVSLRGGGDGECSVTGARGREGVAGWGEGGGGGGGEGEGEGEREGEGG